MSPRIEDKRQRELDLSAAAPGSADWSRELRSALARAIKESRSSRAEIAAAMTMAIYGDTADGEITRAQLDGWTAQSHGAWRFPLEYLPAFIAATGAGWLAELVAAKCGFKAVAGVGVIASELGRLDAVEQWLKAARRRLRQSLTQAIAQEGLDPRLLEGLDPRLAAILSEEGAA